MTRVEAVSRIAGTFVFPGHPAQREAGKLFLKRLLGRICPPEVVRLVDITSQNSGAEIAVRLRMQESMSIQVVSRTPPGLSIYETDCDLLEPHRKHKRLPP